MAGLVCPHNTAHGKDYSKHFVLDGDLHLHHITHCPVHAVLDKFDLHDEFHNLVRMYNMRFDSIGLQLIRARMLIVLAFASLVSWLVRYRFLNMYTRLPPEPQRKEPQIDLFPDTQDEDSKPGLANYLDEFLSAIKVFGYRE